MARPRKRQPGKPFPAPTPTGATVAPPTGELPLPVTETVPPREGPDPGGVRSRMAKLPLKADDPQYDNTEFFTVAQFDNQISKERARLKKDFGLPGSVDLVKQDLELRQNLSRAGLLRFDETAEKNRSPYAVQDARVSAGKQATLLRFAAAKTGGNMNFVTVFQDTGFEIRSKDIDDYCNVPLTTEFAEYNAPGALETGEKARGRGRR